MNDARGEAARDSDAPALAAEDISTAFAMHVRQAPPLAWLSALAALAAMLLNQIFVPALSDVTPREFLFALGRWGDFATNLAAFAGLAALCFGLYAFVRYSTTVGLRQRLLLAGFSGIFLPTITVATLFERQRTTMQIVAFALGSAYVLGALVNSAAARARSGMFARAVALVAATMATVTLVAQALQLASRARLSIWQVQTFEVAVAAGEVCYLLLLVMLSALILPSRGSRRDQAARLLAFFLLPLLIGGLYYAEIALGSDYALLLYHAQRVNLFIDEWPRLYSGPLAIGVAAMIAGALSSDMLRRQGAAGLCLLLSAGFSPHAPGRLLSLALSLLLISRTVIAPSQHEADPIER